MSVIIDYIYALLILLIFRKFEFEDPNTKRDHC